MKELYIAPELKVTCFVPVERLANSEDPLKLELLMDVTVYGSDPSAGVSIEDEDFGTDIP